MSGPFIKVIFLGDTKSGKTQLYNRFVKLPFEAKRVPTGSMLNFGKVKETTYWDYTGVLEEQEERFLGLLYSNANIAIYCVDTSTASLNIERVRDDIAKLKQSSSGVHCILVGTKSDLPAQIDDETLKKLAKEHGFSTYLRLSAMNGDGVEQLSDVMKQVTPQAAVTNNEVRQPEPKEDASVKSGNAPVTCENTSIKWMVLGGFIATLGVAAMALAVAMLNMTALGVISIALLGAAVFIAPKIRFFPVSTDTNTTEPESSDTLQMPSVST